MTIGWQEIAAGILVAGAAAWLVRRAVRARRERVACAHCQVRKIPRPYFSTAKRMERPPSAGRRPPSGP
jgi:ABC-type nickel/cobalt efflux system permease component RcnA